MRGVSGQVVNPNAAGLSTRIAFLCIRARHVRPADPRLHRNPGHAVGGTAGLLDRLDASSQLSVTSRSSADRAVAPRVVAAGGDLQHSAHRGDRVAGLANSHEPEDFLGTVPVSRDNQAAAFARISRSVFNWRFSRRSRRSSSRSSLVSPLALSPSSRSACLIHVRIVQYEGSNSSASSCTLRPARASSTICRRNSGGYGGRVLRIAD